MTWYWLSFVDPDGPEGDRFLGVSIVEAENGQEAVAAAWRLGCNPGGEVAMLPYAADGFQLPAPHLLNRLLTSDELKEYDLA